MKILKPGQDFQSHHFSKDFGFTGSRQGAAAAPAAPAPARRNLPSHVPTKDAAKAATMAFKLGAQIGAHKALSTAAQVGQQMRRPRPPAAPPGPGALGAAAMPPPMPAPAGGAPPGLGAGPPPPGAVPGMKKGGRVPKKDFKPGGHKGKLHREMGIPEGEKIPAARLESATHSSNPEIRRDAIRAKTMKSWKHG